MGKQAQRRCIPIPRTPRTPAATVGKIEVPTAAPAQISAAPLVTIGKITKIFTFKNMNINKFADEREKQGTFS